MKYIYIGTIYDRVGGVFKLMSGPRNGVFWGYTFKFGVHVVDKRVEHTCVHF